MHLLCDESTAHHALRRRIGISFGGRPVSLTEVDAWERRRLRKALRRYGLPADAGRRALAEHKLELGDAGLLAMFDRELAWSARVTRALAAASRGARRHSLVEMTVPGGEPEDIVAWYDGRWDGDERALLAACPDHHVLRRLDDGRLDVVETTGGSPLVSRFAIDTGGQAGLTLPVDPAFPLRIAGVARLGDGTAVGGILHQLRREGAGCRVRLGVEFPAATPPYLATAHRWHLACEFSHWIAGAGAAA